MDLPLVEDFREIVLNQRPLMDLRAPIEFNKGAFPNAVNLPILNDEERRLVGTCYKEKGNVAATKLGHKLIQGEVKSERVTAWLDFMTENPEAYLYCFRGGQRSEIGQTWLKEEGVVVPKLKGGFKKFRNYLMGESERISRETKTLILGGRTGVGKTILIHEISNMIDLEGLANHRGSSFGRYLTPQPTQINFESALSYALIHFEQQNHKYLVLEHESSNIGSVHIQKNVYENFEAGERINLESSLEERTKITHHEYVVLALQNYHELYGESGIQKWTEDIRGSIGRIKRRIGDQRYNHVIQLFSEALDEQEASNSLELHKRWVEFLLDEYYDPMYDYQIAKSKIPLIFSGNKEEVLAFIRSKD